MRFQKELRFCAPQPTDSGFFTSQTPFRMTRLDCAGGLTFFAEGKDRERKHREDSVRRPRRDFRGNYARASERRGQPEREPVAEADADREAEAAPETETA